MTVGLGVDRLAIGNRRCVMRDLDAVTLAEPTELDLQVHRTVAGDDELARGVIAVGSKRRILGGQLLQPLVDLLLVAARLGFDRERIDRLRILRTQELELRARVTDRVAQLPAFDLADREQVPSDHLRDLLGVLAQDPQRVAQLRRVPRPGVDHGHVGLGRAAHAPEVRNPTDVGDRPRP